MNTKTKTNTQVKTKVNTQVLTDQMFKDIVNLNLEDSMCLYAQMLHIRQFEERCALLYTSKDIAGFCHLYSGQEAVAIGIQHILKPGDNIISAYRVHGHGVICRMLNEEWEKYKAESGDIFDKIQNFIEDRSQAKAMLAELTAKQTGCSKGKGGSMHLFDKEYNFYGGHGIVGIQIPLGAGLAMSDKYSGRKNVTFASLGDGAMNQGQVYETFNMASLWKLPVVFVIENNGYAIGTSSDRHKAGGNLHERARPFGIETALVDGMNIEETVNAASWARQYALDNGPVLLEMDTYRYRPHSMSDPATYRTKDEVNDVKQTRDPIETIKNMIKSKFNIDDSVFEKYEEQEEERIDEVVEYCEDCMYPGEEELASDIFI